MNKKELKEEELLSVILKRVSVGDESENYYSFVESETAIKVLKNGTVYFFNPNTDSFIYLYPDQIEFLYNTVKIAMDQVNQVSCAKKMIKDNVE